MQNNQTTRVIGVGNPIVDLLARVDDELIESIPGDKGGMVLVSPDEMEDLLARIGKPAERAPGGSAGNTIFALAELGAQTALIGKIQADEIGDYYQSAFRAVAGDCSRFKFTSEAPTARCLSLVTPDSQRTMRTDLGAAALLSADEIAVVDFETYQHVHLEGYLFFNSPVLMEKAMQSAKAANCTVSLDLGSFEVVKAVEKDLPGLLDRYVDAVFANEDEAAAFCGSKDAETALAAFAKHCEIVAVKQGADGALLKSGAEQCYVPAVPVERVVDTTGAGDLWAAGFLFGHLTGLGLQKSGQLGATIGAEVVQYMGAKLPAESWQKIKSMVA